RPYLWPIKAVMCLGFIMMILQALSEFFKDVARIRGQEI
ncbi:MAG TPA: C4-dicarboxylate ABC transporter, partial [Gammaproteobacteria bacterium]|nr:C4-dicarboxylate ABC transporter [Gammaproteobacteria bacterium]